MRLTGGDLALGAALVAIVSGATLARSAAQTSPPAARPLAVAVREVPPFAMKEASGNWAGLSVELWQDLASELGLTFDWVELPLEATLDALASGEVDVAVAALTITADRERRFDFSHPYYVGGLSFAYAAGGESAWRATLRGFLSPAFVSAVGTLFLVLLAAGSALWFFERRKNAEEFGRGRTLRGLGDGLWWSAVTMTTVGYGDKSPKTFAGRAVALVWMFVSIIIIAGLTASIAASLTTNRLESGFLLSRPVAELHVGVLDRSAAEAYAERQGARMRRYPTIEVALDALAGGEVEVVLHDAPVLKYHVRAGYDGLEVAPKILVRDDYGFGLTEDSPIRESVNTALLSLLREPAWQDLLRRHVGETGAE